MNCLCNMWFLCVSTKSSQYSPHHFIPLPDCVWAGHFVQHWHGAAVWRSLLLNSFITSSFHYWVEMRSFDEAIALQDQFCKEKQKLETRLHYYISSQLVFYSAVLQGHSMAVLKPNALPASVRGTLVVSPGRCCGNDCAWDWHRLGCTTGLPPGISYGSEARRVEYHSSGSDCCWWLLGLFPG